MTLVWPLTGRNWPHSKKYLKLSPINSVHGTNVIDHNTENPWQVYLWLKFRDREFLTFFDIKENVQMTSSPICSCGPTVNWFNIGGYFEKNFDIFDLTTLRSSQCPKPKLSSKRNSKDFSGPNSFYTGRKF